MLSITNGEQVVSKLSVSAWKTLSLHDLNIKQAKEEGGYVWGDTYTHTHKKLGYISQFPSTELDC